MNWKMRFENNWGRLDMNYNAEKPRINGEIMEFIVYIINATADKLGTYTSKIYNILEQSGCINDYLVPCYDVLHTMGTEAIVDDVITYTANRGFKIC